MKETASEVIKELNKFKDPVKAKFLQGFFKTGKGQYAEGDKFLGITVPIQRKVAKKYKSLDLKEIKTLLESPIHEHRLTSIYILVLQYAKSSEASKLKLANFYIKNKGRINNWDIVDSSAPYILGDFLFNREKDLLYKLATSKSLWDRRIAIMSTFGFIRKGDFKDALKLSTILLKDKEDLIHKAVGWMLREVGNRSIETEEILLEKYAHEMPRTMLRYSVEKFPLEKRKYYISLK